MRDGVNKAVFIILSCYFDIEGYLTGAEYNGQKPKYIITKGRRILKLSISDAAKAEFIKINDYFARVYLGSNVVSSHWKKYGGGTFISFDKSFNSVELKAKGFDDFQEKGAINSLKNIPIDFYIKRNLYPLLSGRLIKAIEEVVGLQRRVVSYNCVKQALCLNSVEKAGLDLDEKKIAIIGDGNGFMGMLLKNLYPNVKVIQINLAKVLMFDIAFTSLLDASSRLNVVLKNEDYIKTYDFNFFPAEEIFNIRPDDVDVFFNIASMQEMDLNVIEAYFELIRSQSSETCHFYCCNRVSKKLPDGTTVTFDDYPWLESDKVLFDEECDWYTEFPNSSSFSQKI